MFIIRKLAKGMGIIAVLFTLLFPPVIYSWHGAWFGPGWYGGSWYGQPWGGWGAPGAVIVGPGAGYYSNVYYRQCGWVGAHWNRFGQWVPAHQACW